MESIEALRLEKGLAVYGDRSQLNDLKIAVGVVLFGNTDEQVARIIGSARHALKRCGTSVSSTILVCDNSPVAQRVPLPANVEYVLPEANCGFGAGHNMLMRAAFADGANVYIGSNPDGSFHPDAILAITRLSQACGGTALIEAEQFPDDNLKYYDPRTLETAWVSGACFLVPERLFAETGGFDERIFLYCEDVDFSWMAASCGFKLLHCPTALFDHDVSTRGDDDWRYDQMCLSGRFLGRKWGSDAFQHWCEEQLRQSKWSGPVPDLDDVPRVADADHKGSFEHRFAFSPMR